MKNIFLRIMKTKYALATLLVLFFSVSSCDEGFEELNINPIAPASLDPVYMLVDAQRFGLDAWHYEAEIVQQLQLLIGGQEEGGGRNTINHNNMQGRWNSLYDNQVKNCVAVMENLKNKPERSNLYNMARIVKALAFQWIVDTYGDAPYFDAGKAYFANIPLPKYDNQEAIYDDLVKELTEAVDALDASKDKVTGEMFYKGDIPAWKKLGNSALLRVGMRYTKVDLVKAETIVKKATDPARGGVMAVNADNVIIKYNSVQTNPMNGFCTNSTMYNWHIGKPLVDHFKTNLDPRSQYLVVRYTNPNIASGGTSDTTLANQIGCPYGYDDATVLQDPQGHPGKNGGAHLYSMVNRSRAGRVDAWVHYFTSAQTNLLMAEARHRGWITTSTAQAYYEAGIRQHMLQADTWSDVRGTASPISASKISRYLARPDIVFNPATALKQINEQYWIACFLNWGEAWANFRRSGYPAVAPTAFPGEDQYVMVSRGYDGFIHKLLYTQRENSANQANVEAAVARMGGDNFSIRLFWDKRL
jgi:hypothetical protein